MNLLLCASLYYALATAPPPRADCWAQITATVYYADLSTEERRCSVVVSDNVVIRADPVIASCVGQNWAVVKRECRALNWTVLEFELPARRQKVRFR